jgi:hypothetical protein
MLNISIPAKIQSFVEQQAHDAGFTDASDYVVYLIQQEQKRLELFQDQRPSDEFDPLELMKLPLPERNRILAAQADVMLAHYQLSVS